MTNIDLRGNWLLRKSDDDAINNAQLPGCNYLDLMDNKIIDDVFYGSNEKKYFEVAESDWIYSKKFHVKKDFTNNDFIFLNISGLDTIADIYINNSLIGSGENAYIDYRFDIKNYLNFGENEIKIYFYSPVKYIQKKNKEDKAFYNSNGLDGYTHIRKPAYHFGWDWGPTLPPSGISGDINITAFKKGYINDFKITQEHNEGKVKININAQVLSNDIDISAFKVIIKLFAPDNCEIESKELSLKDNNISASFDVANPVLWFPNGFKDNDIKPLYQIKAQLFRNDEIEDERALKIGLRTIEHDTAPDNFGTQFAFKVNGTRIFCKGANWIPTDSFVTRTTSKQLEYLIKSMADANMNMIRIWGGGYYGSNELYDLCDKYGILVWQDFQFACHPYPLYNENLLETAIKEVEDNVKRIRHHASLALWCGNNEIEMMFALWMFKKRYIDSQRKFFYEILPQKIREFDDITPYWPGSPASGKFLKNVNADDCGDKHMWAVWHGLQPFTFYQKKYPRFLSEFGFESLPDMDTIRSFAEEGDFYMTSPVMSNHQKCASGNGKILYYMVKNYYIPKAFEDLVYISQLSQAESIRYAVEHQRRNSGRCNGTLYWQLNDCWPVNSWSSIDYSGKWKALHYYSKRFNSPIAFSFLKKKQDLTIHCYNENDTQFSGKVVWKIIDFDGRVLDNGETTCNLNTNEVKKSVIIDIKKYKKQEDSIVLTATLLDDVGNEVYSQTFNFVKERLLKLKKPNIETQLSIAQNELKITLKSDTFVKSVMLHLKDIKEPFTDNFFDLIPYEPKTVAIKLDNEVNLNECKNLLTIRSLNLVERKYSRFKELLIVSKTALNPMNIIKKIVYLFT